MTQRKIETGVYGITVSRAIEGGGTITSDLGSPDDGPETVAAIDALESLVLAHACGGIDICSPAYLEGIETAVDAVTNCVESGAVFKELGQDCRRLLKHTPGADEVRRYILFDFDAGDLATTHVYDRCQEAADDASQLDNVIVVPLVFEQRAAVAAEPETTEPDPYHLEIDGPAFRSQRELLLKLQGLAGAGLPYQPAPGEQELLEGLVNLTDELADQAHDKHEIDCLLDPGEAKCDCELPGHFCSGVPGILAHMENGRLAPGAKAQRCDHCQRYPSDQAALEKLRELGMA